MSELDTLRKFETRLLSHIDSKQGESRDHAERLLRLIRERISDYERFMDYEEVTNG